MLSLGFNVLNSSGWAVSVIIGCILPITSDPQFKKKKDKLNYTITS